MAVEFTAYAAFERELVGDLPGGRRAEAEAALGVVRRSGLAVQHQRRRAQPPVGEQGAAHLAIDVGGGPHLPRPEERSLSPFDAAVPIAAETLTVSLNAHERLARSRRATEIAPMPAKGDKATARWLAGVPERRPAACREARSASRYRRRRGRRDDSGAAPRSRWPGR